MITISKSKLYDALDDSSYEFTVHPTYSGRAMYGKTCLGVSGTVNDLLRFVLEIVPAISPSEGDYDEEWFMVSMDDFGRDTIFYWTRVDVNDDTADLEGEHPLDAKYRDSDQN